VAPGRGSGGRRGSSAAGGGAAAEQLSRADSSGAYLPRGWSAEARYPTVVRMPARARFGFTADFGLGRHRSGVHGCSPDSSKFRPVLARPGPSSVLDIRQLPTFCSAFPCGPGRGRSTQGGRGVRGRHRDLEGDLRERRGAARARFHIEGVLAVKAAIVADAVAETAERCRAAPGYWQRDLAVLLIQEPRGRREDLGAVQRAGRVPLIDGVLDRVRLGLYPHSVGSRAAELGNDRTDATEAV
jgi:hypothetical protein